MSVAGGLAGSMIYMIDTPSKWRVSNKLIAPNPSSSTGSSTQKHLHIHGTNSVTERKRKKTRAILPPAVPRLPAAEQRLLGGVHLLEDAGAALGRDGRRGAEADVVARHGVERRVRLPERRPAQQRLLPPVLGHPRVGQHPDLRHRVRHVRVRLVHVDRRPHLADHLLRLAHVLIVRRARRRSGEDQRQRRAQAGAREHVAPPSAAAAGIRSSRSYGRGTRLYRGGKDGGRRGPHLNP
jgi:hypothetical protein